MKTVVKILIVDEDVSRLSMPSDCRLEVVNEPEPDCSLIIIVYEKSTRTEYWVKKVPDQKLVRKGHHVIPTTESAVAPFHEGLEWIIPIVKAKLPIVIVGGCVDDPAPVIEAPEVEIVIPKKKK